LVGASHPIHHLNNNQKPCRSWLASEGDLEADANFKALFAGKPAPTPVMWRQNNWVNSQYKLPGICRCGFGHSWIGWGKSSNPPPEQ
jgi:hypothetical protein